MCVFFTKTSISQELIIKNGDSWNYFDQGNLTTNWYQKNYVSSWKQGVSPLGYGDSSIRTTLDFGDDKENKEITKYFQKEFTLNENNSFLGYEIRLRKDDGAVIYLNGREMYRINMPNNFITADSRALKFVDGEDEDTFTSDFFDTTNFKPGKNIISVEVHQSNENSSDCIFSLELYGYKDPMVLRQVINKSNLQKGKLESQIDVLNSKIETEQIVANNKILEISNQNLKYFLVIVFAFLVIISIGSYLFSNYLRKKEKSLEKKNAKLKSKLIKKNKKLLELDTHLLYNKQYFKELKLEIKNISTNDQSIISSLTSQLDTLINSDKDWENFDTHFAMIYDGFYDRLKKLHPSLTTTELRFCSFVKLHMQTKEIARILLIDPRSVQTARYRIKKKMLLEESTDLTEYLLNI